MKFVSVKEFNPKGRKFQLFVVIPLLCIALVSFLRVFSAQEALFYDVFLKARPLQAVSPDIAIIEIDDLTLSELGQWPLPRDFHASLLDVLREMGAKAVVFDLIFSEPTPYDAVLVQSIQTSGNVYLPEVYDLEQQRPASELLKVPTNVLAAITPTLKGVVKGTGHINVLIDSDGKARKVPLYIRGQEGLIPQMGLQVASTLNTHLRLPTPDSNELLINYPGSWKNTFQHFSYYDILSKYKQYKTDQSLSKTLQDLRGKVCFIGLVATGTVDLKPSPLENNYPMVGVIASTYNSVVQGKFLTELSRPLQLLYVMVLYLFCIFVCLGLKPWQSLMSCLGLVGLCALITGVSLGVAGCWIDVFFPILVIALVYVVCSCLRWAGERRKLEFIEKEMAIAQNIQMQFLQGPQQESYDLDVAVWLEPAKYVAGDFYDLFKVDEYRSGIFIGDVSGKGLPAALCMAQTISLFRIFSRLQSPLDQTLNRLNQELCLRNIDRFATAMYCMTDAESKTVTVACAGHGPLYIYRHDKEKIVELRLAATVPLGVMSDSEYSSVVFNVEPNDKLFLLSDGIYEARNSKGEEIGIERIKEHFLSQASKPNQEILESFKVLMREYGDGEQQYDDMTLIIFSLKPKN